MALTVCLPHSRFERFADETRLVPDSCSCGRNETVAAPQTRSATLTLDFDKNIGPMEMDHISLGQGGLSPDPMWDNRIAEIRALHPHLIRLFVQEYFDLLPTIGQYHFDRLDPSVDEIVRAGALPLMCITIKPKALLPKGRSGCGGSKRLRRVGAADLHLVSHYKEKGLSGLYWEVGNEGDIGESGGSPYRFAPEDYMRYYRHTAAAILQRRSYRACGRARPYPPGSRLLLPR